MPPSDESKKTPVAQAAGVFYVPCHQIVTITGYSKTVIIAICAYFQMRLVGEGVLHLVESGRLYTDCKPSLRRGFIVVNPSEGLAGVRRIAMQRRDWAQDSGVAGVEQHVEDSPRLIKSGVVFNEEPAPAPTETAPTPRSGAILDDGTAVNKPGKK